MPYKLDTESAVYFYEQEFYVLSNFSAFRLQWQGVDFDTSEHAYHWSKFPPFNPPPLAHSVEEWKSHARRQRLQRLILAARSAHDAFKVAEQYAHCVRADWSNVKVDIMRAILWAKVQQHEYVRRKLLETGERTLIEDSWRDSFWGWGADRTGKNALGTLWMEIRAALRAQEAPLTAPVPPAALRTPPWSTR